MDMQSAVREAIAEELRRQAEISEGSLKVEVRDGTARIDGPVDLEALVMVVAGSIAGGP